MRLAVVVPTLNEEAALRRRLPDLLAQLEAGDEVVISDGGSADGTAEVARALGVRVVAGPAGRGAQLNRGAAAFEPKGEGEVLLFLHADTRLPAGAGAAIRAAVAGGAEAGAFLIRFESDRRWLRLGERLVNWRTRRFRVPLGDQAQFVTRAAFERLGGFRDWPILEDLDLALRLRRLRRPARLAVIDRPVTTSARRFHERGICRNVATNWLIWILFALGVSPHRLARLYREIR